MRLYRQGNDAYLQLDNRWLIKREVDWDELINRKKLHDYLMVEKSKWDEIEVPSTWIPNAPIKNQEVWAAGVTYLKSKVARMEEAEAAGGGDFYDRVYDAERPEIFFKATAPRTVGPEEDVFIRSDSSWNVPEPELTLFCSSEGSIEAYTIGNDMSSRSIEGENPLYLPQAKTYDRSAALGPCLLILKEPISQDTEISMSISRARTTLYSDSVAIRQMKRKLPELVHFLFRACSFPYGCFLMTGTCLVPDDDFTLQSGDHIAISIDGIGELKNMVALRQIND